MEELKVESITSEGQIQSVNDAPVQNNEAPVNTVEQSTQPAAVVENTPQVKYAGFWIRWVAVVVDAIVVAIMAIPIMAAFYFLSGGTFSGDESEMPAGINFLSYTVSWAYYILMTDKYQATLGKKLVGIIVTTEDFKKASLGNIVLRETVGKVISGMILLIGYIMAAFTNRKRALHDIIAGTVVIYNPNSKSPKGVLIGILVAGFLFFVVIIGILASIVLVSLNNAKDKAGVAAFKSQAMGLLSESLLVCDEEILTQDKPANAGKFLGERNFITGTRPTDCGPNGSGEFSFTVDSVGLPEKCTANITDQGATFEGC